MTTEKRMVTALLLSALAHGLIFIAGDAGPLFPPEPVKAGSISVRLAQNGFKETAAEKKTPAPEAEPPAQGTTTADKRAVAPERPLRRPPEQPKSIEPRRTKERPVTSKPPEPVAAAAPGLRKTERPSVSSHRKNTGEAESSPATSSGGPQPAPGVRQVVLARLEEELAKHFQYPYLARRRGWEGKVVLGLRIDRRGTIDSTEIAESSGHGILDRAALDALARVSRIPGAAERLGGAELYLELPVIYRLREG